MRRFGVMKRYAALLLLCSACSDHSATYPDLSTIPDANTTGTGGTPSAGGSSGGGTPSSGGGRIVDAGRDARTDARPPSGGCAVDPVTKCPSPKPSYKSDVVPIMNAKCMSCHSGADANGPWPLTDLQEIVDWKTQFIRDVQTCTMPPLDAGVPLTAEESATLLGWLVCGAPNN